MRALVLAGVLAAAACGGETGGVLGETAERAAAGEAITFELRPAVGDGIAGTATIAPVGDPGRTAVSVSVDGGTVTLARGSCSVRGDTAADLAGGLAPFSLSELLEGDFAVVVERPGAPASCGDVPDAVHIPGEA